MHKGSKPSDRPSITSRRTSNTEEGRATGRALLDLIDALPEERLARAFTHTSWARDRSDSYERLEFLGDSVLGLAIARELYERFPDYQEGELAKIRAHVVSRQSCAVVGRALGLGDRLVEVGEGTIPPDELGRLARNRNVIAALVEAALGALYLEHGFEPIRAAVLDAFLERIEYAVTTYVDFKTELQEELARRGQSVSYAVLAVEGPPHQRRFTCAAVVDGEQLGTGEGASKKAAEQDAAREALARVRDS
ncbi:MAG TPA: ribonuclease III [Gaiellaceae bacterium]|jgi:ribonuclease-3